MSRGGSKNNMSEETQQKMSNGVNNQTQEKKFVCRSCGSESSGTSGTCCGAERKEASSNVCVACQTGTGEHAHQEMEKKTENKCESCGHEHRPDDKPACGCK